MSNIQTECRINIPEGMEIDRENSTFECIKFKPKTISYTDIQKNYLYDATGKYSNNLTCSHWHVHKLEVYKRLCEVAQYFNNGWKPDWYDSEQRKFSIYFDCLLGGLNVMAVITHSYGLPLFKNCEDAQKAIDIIGKENLKILFI